MRMGQAMLKFKTVATKKPEPSAIASIVSSSNLLSLVIRVDVYYLTHKRRL